MSKFNPRMSWNFAWWQQTWACGILFCFICFCKVLQCKLPSVLISLTLESVEVTANTGVKGWGRGQDVLERVTLFPSKTSLVVLLTPALAVSLQTKKIPVSRFLRNSSEETKTCISVMSYSTNLSSLHLFFLLEYNT